MSPDAAHIVHTLLAETGRWIDGTMAPSAEHHAGALFAAKGLAKFIHDTFQYSYSPNNCHCAVCFSKKIEYVNKGEFQLAPDGNGWNSIRVPENQ